MNRSVLLILSFSVIAIGCGGEGASDDSAQAPSAVSAHWSCSDSSQCAAVMGATSGTTAPFSTASACAAWCQAYMPGNCSCN